MLYLVDTGVLLRLFNRADPASVATRRALSQVRQQGHRPVVSLQNVAEYWNVCTRPPTARGGLGMSVEETARGVRVIERICPVLPDAPHLYQVWRKLLTKYEVRGVQVHDARLVAWMMSQSITHIITFNPSDFSRYEGIKTMRPTVNTA
jgi:predicted nucleic acid-binding protein